jgi:hypothetical protein
MEMEEESPDDHDEKRYGNPDDAPDYGPHQTTGRAAVFALPARDEMESAVKKSQERADRYGDKRIHKDT